MPLAVTVGGVSTLTIPCYSRRQRHRGGWGGGANLQPLVRLSSAPHFGRVHRSACLSCAANAFWMHQGVPLTALQSWASLISRSKRPPFPRGCGRRRGAGIDTAASARRAAHSSSSAAAGGVGAGASGGSVAERCPRMAAALWASSDAGEWQAQLDGYAGVVERKGKEGLVELDR